MHPRPAVKEMKHAYIGRMVTVTVERPMGSCHPVHKSLYYPINYGYIEGIPGGDGEAQDAYIVGVDAPIAALTGRVIAVIHRADDVEEKWVVAPEGVSYTRAEIAALTEFQERYFDSSIET